MKLRQKVYKFVLYVLVLQKTNFFAWEGTKTPGSAMASEEVAAYAYKGLMKNKDIIIPGFGNVIKNWVPVKLRIMFFAKLKNEIIKYVY